MALPAAVSKGECEVCGTPDVKLRLQKLGNILMCEGCWADEQATVAANAKAVIATSQKIDSTIQLKADIFNAATVSFTELQAAILANTEIPAEKKSESLLTEVASRIAALDTAIFTLTAETVAKQNERNSLLTSAQQIHARLRESERVKFKQFDVNYKVVTPKTVKPKPITVKKTKPNITLILKVAKETGMPASSIRTSMLQKGISEEQAGKYLLLMTTDSKEAAETYLKSLK